MRTAERVLGRLRETLAAYASSDGVWLDSRAWIVKPRRAERDGGTSIGAPAARGSNR
jgi:hypothetical protein